MTSRLLAAVVVLAAVVLGGRGSAAAQDKKRVVVVLDFEGPKADRFHDELVKLIRKTHTVLSTDRWNGTAEELGAGTGSDKDIKKVAKKLKVDAVIEGKIEKRRDEFIIRLKLHDGKSGGVVGAQIDAKSDSTKLEGKVGKELKDELVDAIGNVEPNGGGGGGDDEDRPKKKKKDDDTAKKDDDADAAPKKFSKRRDAETGGDKVDKPDDADAPPKKKKAEVAVVADDPPPKKKKKPVDDDSGDTDRKPAKKKVASTSDDASAEVDSEPPPADADFALSPGERAVDAVAGLSFVARNLAFTTKGMPAAKPLNYSGALVAGAMLDATFYPLAFGHDSKDLLKNLGVNVMVDKVLKIDSREGSQVFATSEQRFGIAAVFRYAFSRSVTSPVVIGSFGFASQAFTIGKGAGVPSVSYEIFDPGAQLIYPITAKILASVDARALFIPKAGDIALSSQYGGASVLGFEGAAYVDLLLTRNLFARVAFRAESIGFKFKGDGALSQSMDMMSNAVPTARDTYLGGYLTLGYLY